ncbi:unnamed protein product [Lasius platythorax]|uniref:Uncharacterized protein n=1 Tax=Lasius platythorax TaxID=488582 RepID=A0AAV2NMW2_9HYME
MRVPVVLSAFPTLFRNKWTFKLQPRTPSVVGTWPSQWMPITDAAVASARQIRVIISSCLLQHACLAL